MLGVGITAADTNAELAEAAARARVACQSLRYMDDPTAELALLRMSLNGCRVTHLLRGAGPDVSEECLADFDTDTESALSGLLGTQLPGHCWAQATSAAGDGGLGLRQASEVRLPAFLASSIEARPLARELSVGLPEQLREAAFARWDSSAAAARAEWLGGLAESSRGVGEQLLHDGEDVATARVHALLGLVPDHQGEPRPSPGAAAAAILVTPAGAEDPEAPGKPANLQTRLSDLAARHRVGELERELEFAGDLSGVRRLRDLRDPGTDHSWIWVACSFAGSCLRKHEFCTALLLRLGAPVAAQQSPCAICGGMMDARGLHALRCAPGEATKGHNRVRDQLLGLASLGDTTSAVEPRGLVPSQPGLRPADILSTAAFARPAALDVSVACPDSAGAGTDCCSAVAQEKLEKYAPYLDELWAEGISYVPLVWSCWGRPHEDATAAVRSMAAGAARRRGDLQPDALRARTTAMVGLQLARRAARMVGACLPPQPDLDVAAALDAAVRTAQHAGGRAGSDCCSDSDCSIGEC